MPLADTLFRSTNVIGSSGDDVKIKVRNPAFPPETGGTNMGTREVTPACGLRRRLGALYVGDQFSAGETHGNFVSGADLRRVSHYISGGIVDDCVAAIQDP